MIATLVCAAIGVALALSSSAAATPAAKDPNSIACPAAPSGWTLPATGGKKVEDAQTDIRLRAYPV
jgi:hypothetical protein